jgi:RNA polymerase sigma-70 factor (ECF subfamily)
MHHLQGVPLAEVARQMGRSLDSIKKLWLRGLARLRRVLEEAS